MKHFLIALALCTSACAQAGDYTHLTSQETSRIVERARELVLNSKLLKNEEEIQSIKTTAPTLTYYFLAKPYAQYFIQWKTSSEERILVSGQGDIFSLENAKIDRLTLTAN